MLLQSICVANLFKLGITVAVIAVEKSSCCYCRLGVVIIVKLLLVVMFELVVAAAVVS